MKAMNLLALYGIGVIVGGLLAIQSVLNATLGRSTGIVGSVLVLTAIGLAISIAMTQIFPGAVTLQNLPSLSEWYLYLGAVLGVLILAAPILLVPRIGTSSTLVAIVLGQLSVAIAIDHWGLLASPKIEADMIRVLGIAFVAFGAFLVSQ